VKPSYAFLLPLLLGLFPPLGLADQVSVTSVRITPEADKTRLVLDLGGSVVHQIFALEGPDRLVIDLRDAAFSGTLPQADAGDPTLVGLRSGVREGDDLRIVVDLKRPVRAKSFPLAPDESQGHRLVVDLIPKDVSQVGKAASTRVGKGDKAQPVASSRARAARPLVVAIDAGHGGEDPGALGARGTREKDVTLAIARRLAALVEKEPGMHPLMIRDKDVFVPLRQRILKARKHEADIFISIHADAYTDAKVRGSSVFTLSHRGASSEAAKWLADKENSADLIGGVDLSKNDDLLASVLLDMAQNATLEHSVEAAGAVLSNLRRLGTTHRGEVQKAGFVVLKSPDMPSLLVETAFISNPDEEARLVNGAQQQQLAEAILAGVKQYFRKYRPQAAVRSAAAEGSGRQHRIGSGDTLTDIAKRYQVSLSSLRSANNLTDDTIRAGQVLTIPGAEPGDG
jgi:N-acetylmuramoyl-L-alanine amidase